jgi:hypothetical protein
MTVDGLSRLGPSSTPPVRSPRDTIQMGVQTWLREATVRPPARISRWVFATRRRREPLGRGVEVLLAGAGEQQVEPDLDAVRRPRGLAGESGDSGLDQLSWAWRAALSQ